METYKCATEGCNNQIKARTHCATCRSKKTRAKDPIKYIWSNLKSRAKQRPKEFTLDLEEFRAWCIKENFRIGIDTVDREKNEHGYHIWNIQKLLLIENIKKYHHHDKHKKPEPIPESDYKPVDVEPF